MKNYYSIFLLLIIFSCGSMLDVRDANDEKNPYTIRYVNLNIIFSYLTSKNPDAVKLKNRREELIKYIENTGNVIDIHDKEKKKKSAIEIDKVKLEIIKIKTDEEQIKSKILNRIDKVLITIARKENIDFIFNYGEGTVYARKEYDITEKVLREIISQKNRSSPISR